MAADVSAYERLKADIFTGRLRPGSILVAEEIAARLGTSRTPVREALGRLEQDGLVTRAGHRLAVRLPSDEEILDIYEARTNLEVAVARTAAARRRPADCMRLEAMHRRTVELALPSGESRFQANLDFHRAVWIASHHATYIDLLERLNLQLARYPMTTLMYPGRWEHAVAEHLELVRAVLDGDQDRAGAVAKVHFSEARDIRLRIWQEQLVGGHSDRSVGGKGK